MYVALVRTSSYQHACWLRQMWERGKPYQHTRYVRSSTQKRISPISSYYLYVRASISLHVLLLHHFFRLTHAAHGRMARTIPMGTATGGRGGALSPGGAGIAEELCKRGAQYLKPKYMTSKKFEFRARSDQHFHTKYALALKQLPQVHC